MRIGVVGLGKMGLSHLSMLGGLPGIEVAGACDSSSFLLSMLRKNTKIPMFSDYARMLDEVDLDAVLIATPSGSHAEMVRAAIDRRLHVFCEKPFCLDPNDASKLSEAAESAGLVTQVGYHNRFVGAFREVKTLLDAGEIGDVTHVLAEAYGPVVLKPQRASWRTSRAEGGGCLYDYAAHPLNLVNWYLGEPNYVSGTVLNSIFSRDTDDEVFSTLHFDGGRSAQLSVNWSDDSVRKMTTRITIWGTKGRIFADRQECQVYLREVPTRPGYQQGWNVRYTTELTEPVEFYLRGEEYSAQLEAFARRVEGGEVRGSNDFRSAAMTDRVMESMRVDSESAQPPRRSLGSPRPNTKGPAERWAQARDSVQKSPTFINVRAYGRELAARARKARSK